MSEWIDVKQELPVGEDHLLLVRGPELLTMHCVGYWNRLMKSWVVNGERMDGLDVTHWMPLPEPPKGGEQHG